MRKLIFICIVLVLIKPVFANDVDNITILAKEIGPELIRLDFDFAYKSTVKHQGNYTPKVSYIAKYQIIFVIVKNNSESILNINPNYFTLVSNKKISYSYSSETHVFKEKVGFLDENPIQTVDVYPGTISEGFLLFEKRYEGERPQKLFFKNLNKHISTDIILDKKVKVE
jgi:hypothetical protein